MQYFESHPVMSPHHADLPPPHADPLDPPEDQVYREEDDQRVDAGKGEREDPGDPVVEEGRLEVHLLHLEEPVVHLLHRAKVREASGAN